MKGTQRKEKWRKVLSKKDEFTLFQNSRDPMTWEVSFKISSGKYLRKRFNADGLDSALGQAKEKSGIEPIKKKKRFTVGEAFMLNRTAAIPNQKPATTKDYDYWVKRFLKWLAKHHPERRTWNMLDSNIVEEFLESVPMGSRFHAIKPLRQTSRLMARKYGTANFCDGLLVKKKLQRTPVEVYLEDVVAFCDFLRDKHPELEAGIALQGLAGLQLQEATRLTWDRVDLEYGLVEISGEVKNEYRNRVIPLCDQAIEALRRANASRQDGNIRNVNEHVLISLLGYSFEQNWLNYSKQVVKALKEWNPQVDWKPKDMRNCLPTFAAIHGLRNDLWEMYIGHAPRLVTARHYIPRLNSATRGEKGALKRQMDLFRLHVTEPLNCAIEGNFEAKILNFFERDGNQPLDPFKILQNQKAANCSF